MGIKKEVPFFFLTEQEQEDVERVVNTAMQGDLSDSDTLKRLVAGDSFTTVIFYKPIEEDEMEINPFRVEYYICFDPEETKKLDVDVTAVKIIRGIGEVVVYEDDASFHDAHAEYIIKGAYDEEIGSGDPNEDYLNSLLPPASE